MLRFVHYQYTKYYGIRLKSMMTEHEMLIISPDEFYDDHVQFPLNLKDRWLGIDGGALRLQIVLPCRPLEVSSVHLRHDRHLHNELLLERILRGVQHLGFPSPEVAGGQP